MKSSLFRQSTGAAIFAAPLSLGLLAVCTSVLPAQQKVPPAKAVAKPASAPDTVRAQGLPIDGVAAIVGDQVVLISEVAAEAARQSP